MNNLRCPGRKANEALDTVEIPCPACGAQVEIFGDEARVHCRCGEWVTRDAVPSCAEWCPEAEACFGAIGGFKRPAGASARAGHQEEQLERFRALQKRIRDALSQCSRPDLKERGTTPESVGTEESDEDS
ncbi:MAG: hypothetical protein GWP08_00170 [Nitrospiraceae bacterium]|nr:hypothetical protein [Nitrospiraceae bacterium]